MIAFQDTKKAFKVTDANESTDLQKIIYLRSELKKIRNEILPDPRIAKARLIRHKIGGCLEDAKTQSDIKRAIESALAPICSKVKVEHYHPEVDVLNVGIVLIEYSPEVRYKRVVELLEANLHQNILESIQLSIAVRDGPMAPSSLNTFAERECGPFQEEASLPITI